MLQPHTATISAPASVAALTIPERMAAVIRERAHEGQPTTRADFHQALETCDLTDGQLDANIGAAKRLVHPEVVRQSEPRAVTRDGRHQATTRPPTGVAPWDFAPDYRRERVMKAAALVTGLLPGDDVAFAALRNASFCSDEIAALWPEIMREVGARPIFGADAPVPLATAIGRANAMNAVTRARAAVADRDPRVRVVDLDQHEPAKPFECPLSEVGLDEDERAATAAELHARGTAIVGGGAAPAYRLELIA